MAWHLVLPVITLTIVSVGSLMRYTRTNMLEVLNADYIRTARAKGLPEKRVIHYHAFRNIVNPDYHAARRYTAGTLQWCHGNRDAVPDPRYRIYLLPVSGITG